MNFKDTLKSVELVIKTGEVPLIVGESGIGKTDLARQLARQKKWHLVTIDGNLLKEGEIGGLPTVEEYVQTDEKGKKVHKKATIYAVHYQLREIDEAILEGKEVLLFIDEINRCEHAVQQELMNLILNKQINGYHLSEKVHLLAAMNPGNRFGGDFEYEVTQMDPAQENRFVWLRMESDPQAWIEWAIEYGIEEKVIEFISVFPEYLHKKNEEDIDATPRSYQRLSKSYALYQKEGEAVSKEVFLNIVKGNVGEIIARAFLHFIEKEQSPLVRYEEIFLKEERREQALQKIKKESHTRLYLTSKNLLTRLEKEIVKENQLFLVERLIELLEYYPVDLRVGVMKDIKRSYPRIYEVAIEQEAFIALYFKGSYGIGGS